MNIKLIRQLLLLSSFLILMLRIIHPIVLAQSTDEYFGTYEPQEETSVLKYLVITENKINLVLNPPMENENEESSSNNKKVLEFVNTLKNNDVLYGIVDSEDSAPEEALPSQTLKLSFYEYEPFPTVVLILFNQII